MGISGLLPALKTITRQARIEDFRGKTVAIDGYCWLHRGVYGCSQEVCLGQKTDKYVNYFMERIDFLIRNQVTPYVVFDGGPLPMKRGTELQRRSSREKNRQLGRECLAKRRLSEARKYFIRAVDVSPLMAFYVIQQLKKRNVAYVVAPYEADAQLAFLMHHRLVDAVISEDSDCLVYGCHKVLYKMDQAGFCEEVDLTKLKQNKAMNFQQFTHEMFVDMCILSGCDYLPSLPGVGLKRAHGFLKQYGNHRRILQALRLDGKTRVPVDYESDFEKARLTFRHQKVYDPRQKRVVPLTPFTSEMDANASEFLGEDLPDEIAQAIAEGRIDPIDQTPFPDVEDTATRHGNTTRASRTSSKPMTSPASSAQGTSTPGSSSKAATINAKSIASHFFTPRQQIVPSQELSQEATQPEDDSCLIARTISFSPVDDLAKHKAADTKQPTCAAIGSQSINSSINSHWFAPNKKENAFTRMMRAGSTLPKRKQPDKKRGSIVFASSSTLKKAKVRTGLQRFFATRLTPRSTPPEGSLAEVPSQPDSATSTEPGSCRPGNDEDEQTRSQEDNLKICEPEPEPADEPELEPPAVGSHGANTFDRFRFNRL